MAKRYRLKKSAMYKGAIILAVLFIATVFGKQKYDEYMYKKTYVALRKALEPYADDLNEMDNLYILKMKKKIKKWSLYL